MGGMKTFKIKSTPQLSKYSLYRIFKSKKKKECSIILEAQVCTNQYQLTFTSKTCSSTRTLLSSSVNISILFTWLKSASKATRFVLVFITWLIPYRGPTNNVTSERFSACWKIRRKGKKPSSCCISHTCINNHHSLNLQFLYHELLHSLVRSKSQIHDFSRFVCNGERKCYHTSVYFVGKWLYCDLHMSECWFIFLKITSLPRFFLISKSLICCHCVHGVICQVNVIFILPDKLNTKEYIFIRND